MIGSDRQTMLVVARASRKTTTLNGRKKPDPGMGRAEVKARKPSLGLQLCYGDMQSENP